MSHVVITVVGMILTYVLFGNPIIGGLLATFLFIGREHAQAEYRYMHKHGLNRESSPWCKGFKRESWDLKSILDWALPLIVTIAVAIGWFYEMV